MSKAQCTIWIAYNTENESFASHEGAQEAIEGLLDVFSQGEGVRVVELNVTLPSIKPLTAQVNIPDRDGPISVILE